MSDIINKEDDKLSKFIEHPFTLLVFNSIAMGISGLALGWMVGMSTTPIIKDVIVSILAVFTTIMGLIAGYSAVSKVKDGILELNNTTPNKESEQAYESGIKQSQGKNVNQQIKENTIKSRPLDYIKGVNLFPIGLFMICMAIGGTAGIYTRVNYLLIDLPKEKKEKFLEIKAKNILNDTTSNKPEFYENNVEWP